MFFLEVVVIFFIFTSGSSSAVKRRDACRTPQSAEFYSRRLGSGARPTITGGQTRERWSDAMASARRRASLERVVCSLFFILI